MQFYQKFLASATIWIVALLTTGIFFTGCKKDSDKDPEIKITLALSTSTLDFESAGGTQTFNITSNASAWKVNVGNNDWLTVTPTDGSNNSTVSVTATANIASKPREATITVSATGAAAQTVKVTQAAATLDQTWRSLLQTAMNSSPTHSYSNGDRYKGQTATVATNLLGAIRYADGDFGIGGYNYGSVINRHGFGVYIVYDFDANYIIAECLGCKIYAGNWSNNLKEGMGACYDKTGARIYYGEFKDNKPVGTYPSASAPDYNNTFEITKAADGSYYLGENSQGKRNGYGIYLYANRDIWYGPWKDGLRDGYGILVYANGTLRVGTWKGDTYAP